jgi:hypothetical protein
MNIIIGVLIGWLVFMLGSSFSEIGDMIVERSSDEIVARVLKAEPERPAERREAVEMVIKPTPKPRDPKQEMFMEMCPKYGFSENHCERIWKQDVQIPLTPNAKGVKIEDIETSLIEEKE